MSRSSRIAKTSPSGWRRRAHNSIRSTSEEHGLGQLRALVRLVRRLRPDVVHTTLWEADVLGRLAGMLTGTPVVSTLPTSDERPSALANPGVRPVKLRLARWIDIATARGVVRFHAVSETVADRMSVALRVRRDRVTVIPRARRRDLLGEPSPERRLRVRRELGLGDRVPLVLAVARHEHQKGLDVLVGGVPTIRMAVPEVVVLVAGRQGRMTDRLRWRSTPQASATASACSATAATCPICSLHRT